MDVPFTVVADCDLGARAVPWMRGNGADVTIAQAPVPEALPNPESAGLAWQRSGDRVLIMPPCGIRFLVEGGEAIRYQLADGVGGADMRLFLLGTAWPVLAMQRGLLPLHASAVARGADVHAFIGGTAAGKSTLAAALAGRGLPFFADDVVLLDPARLADEAVCHGYDDLKLWSDGLALTAVPAGGPVREVAGFNKRYAAPSERSRRVEGRLRSLRLLQASHTPGNPLRDEPVRGRAALRIVYNAVHRRPFAVAIVGHDRLFEWLLRLLRHADVFVFHRAMAPARFGDGVAMLARVLAADAQT